MTDSKESLTFSLSSSQSHFYQVSITVSPHLVAVAYQQAVQALQVKIEASGFGKGAVPREYVEHNYHSHLKEHVKKFLFHFLVVSFLFKKLREQKVIFIGDPRLKNITIDLAQSAVFEFECTKPDTQQTSLLSWKHLPFKAPGRKHYRDIDRQVETFIQEEQELRNSMGNPLKVAIGDLVCFTIWVVDEQHTALFDDYKETLWLKIGNEEGDIPFQQLFLEKCLGEIFYTTNHTLSEYFSDHERYALFAIQICAILPVKFFCIESLKEHFTLKSAKDVRRKLIEIFSFRNDISQRRLMAEGALTMLLKHHPFNVPHHAILRKQQSIMETLSMNPDYPVYKMERDFTYKVEQLALRQLRESIMVDRIAYDENIGVTPEDIQHYLNLTKRQRTKEFIYFTAPPSKLNGQEIPVPAELLKHYIRREKTLNYVINHLTKN